MSPGFLFVIVGLALTCRTSPVAQSGSPAANDADDYAIYGEVIDSLLFRRQPLSIAVIDTTTLNPPLDLQASGPLGRMLDSSAPGLRDALERAVQTRVPLRRAFSLPGSVTMISRSAAMERLRVAGPSGDRARVASGAGYVAFSAIGFSPDGQSAAVYVEYHCGGLCGGAYVVVLARKAERSWGIQQVHTRLLF